MPVIKIRRGTTTQWNASSRVLEVGELGIDTTLNRIKAGNGTNVWSALPYLSLSSAEIEELSQDAVSTALAAGTHSNITVTYSDNGNSISLATGPDVITQTSLSNTLTNPTTGYVSVGDVGQADGVASLDSGGKVPDSEIPTAIARLASPTFTGTPAAPTATAGTNTTQVATTAFVGTAVSNLVNAAPESLNTLKELSDALGADANYASTITTALGTKEPLLPAQTGNSGKFLTTDGTSKSWSTVAQYTLPTQTSNSGKFLTTNGSVESWATIPVTSSATPAARGTVFGTTGTNGNVGLGSSTLAGITSGNANTAVGDGALAANTTAYQNTALGRFTLSTNTTGQWNVAVGYASLLNSNSSGNVALGQDSLGALSTGDYNIAIGFNAGKNGTTDLTTGSNNIIIGKDSAPSSATISNEITLGNSSITKFRIPGLGIEWTSNPDIMNIMEAW